MYLTHSMRNCVKLGHTIPSNTSVTRNDRGNIKYFITNKIVRFVSEHTKGRAI
jgi:hypothetical protein